MTNDRQHRPSLKVAVPSNRLRRFAPWFIFVALIVLIQCYFTTFRDSEFIKSTLEVLGSYKNRHSLKPQPLHVLLVAYARTGSSFIGDLMQSIPDSFYHFEPLHFIGAPVLNHSFDQARDLLGHLFVCSISQIQGLLPWYIKHRNFMKLQRNIRYWEICSKNSTCYDGIYIDHFCRNQSIVIIKTIRINLLEASKLFTSHPHLNLKIIYLTRDPRGTMNSRMKKPVKVWCKQDPMCFNSRHFCAGISADLNTVCSLSVNKPKDFMVIRYEDVSSDPYSVSVQIAKFLGLLSVPDQMHEFLKTHTYFAGNIKRRSKSAGLEYPYTTFRNSSITAMSWRKEMSLRNVTLLQNVCRPFLSAFGYHSYGTLPTLRANTDMNMNLRTALASRCNISST